jgi:hypothetical protein
MSAVVDVFQLIIGYFIYGCDIFDDSCDGSLPSLESKDLTVSEVRAGSYHMSTGCNSEFEGEIVWYQPVHAIVTKLLDTAADSILEFINIPINVIKLILDADMLELLSRMGDVCDYYLDGYVQLAKVEATFENTRYALSKRSPAETRMT